MRLKRLIRTTFEKGNTCIDGLRGCGKDMLMANVIARRRKPYISNIDYKVENYGAVHIPLNFVLLDSGNTYENIINNDIRFYDYPYMKNCDVYISDCGIIFPSQYDSELNKKYEYMSMFMALSRHLGKGTNFHYNVQSLSRVWLKLREQSDIYIKCNSCCVLSNTFLSKIPIIRRIVKDLVIQRITIYEKYQSCLDRVEPFIPIRVPLLADKSRRAVIEQQNIERKARYDEVYGKVKRRLLVYRNKSDYDTYYYNSLFKGGKK